MRPGANLTRVSCVSLSSGSDNHANRLKLLLIATLLLISAFCSVKVAAKSNSVKGEKTLGIRGGYASYNESGYNSIFFEYTFAPHFRISPEIGYVYSHYRKTAFKLDADMQFPFRIVSGLQIYPLAGLAFNNWSYKDDSSKSRLGADLGAGLDFYMTQNLKLNVQAKYSWLPDVSGLFAGLGIGYIF